MGNTTFYSGTLKDNVKIEEAVKILKDKFKAFQWRYEEFESGIIAHIEKCEDFVFHFQDRKIKAFVKYVGEDTNVQLQIFEVLRLVKPCFKRLNVQDDLGMWYDYIAGYSKTKEIVFRELKQNELDEFERNFDLPAGSTSIWGMNQAQAVLMWMICKDMNEDFSEPMTIERLLSKLHPVYKKFYEYNLDAEEFQFLAVVETWFATKLKFQKLSQEKVLFDTRVQVFSYVMADEVMGFYGGCIDGKHSKIIRFVEKLKKQGVDFEEAKNFMRLIYSVMEELGAYRPDELIERTS